MFDGRLDGAALGCSVVAEGLVDKESSVGSLVVDVQTLFGAMSEEAGGKEISNGSMAQGTTGSWHK
jgi:hypothetical protein